MLSRSSVNSHHEVDARPAVSKSGFFGLSDKRLFEVRTDNEDTRRQNVREGRFLVGCFRHQLLLPRPYLVLTKPLRLDIQCQRGASVKIGWKYLDD